MNLPRLADFSWEDAKSILAPDVDTSQTCIRCGKPAMSGRKLCAGCDSRFNAFERDLIASRRQATTN